MLNMQQDLICCHASTSDDKPALPPPFRFLSISCREITETFVRGRNGSRLEPVRAEERSRHESGFQKGTASFVPAYVCV